MTLCESFCFHWCKQDKVDPQADLDGAELPRKNVAELFIIWCDFEINK